MHRDPDPQGHLRQLGQSDLAFADARPRGTPCSPATIVGTALAVFAGIGIATAKVEENEVKQSLDEPASSTCDVVNNPTCSRRAVDDVGGQRSPTTESTAPATDRRPAGRSERVGRRCRPPTVETTHHDDRPGPIPKLALGDSVMLGAASQLAALGFTVDAVESRPFVDGVDRRDPEAAGPTRRRRASCTSAPTERSAPIDDADDEALADVPQVLLLTIDVDKEWTQGNNELIYATAENHPNVELVDWDGLNDAVRRRLLLLRRLPHERRRFHVLRPGDQRLPEAPRLIGRSSEPFDVLTKM